MFLDDDAFKNVIKNTPLISIDLIIQNEKGEYLVGKRNNRPARGFWFVPGGRIQKNETLNNGFTRLIQNEIGIEMLRNETTFLGVFEHFYDDNYFNSEFSTHYIVLAYKISILSNGLVFPREQHNEYLWMSADEIINNDLVHFNTKAYFIDVS
ncbi:GDP-mannose mannosyl hydrolase [Klebsiella sp. JN_Kp127]|uniref:GDP-mannose mannosyl hydrolase n=1 Tax=Klebsiella sp. JN_Kp127 TaxID=3153439 RepID=UPI0032B3236D|nr:GDP-mannose mannosyl hydrolase [Klebsiella quasipneumoniae subsp. quasipneumoniae]